MKLSIVVPVLDEADGIAGHLAALADLRVRGAEIIVVDGGSGDGTATRALAGADKVLISPMGRARQMNAGTAAASGDLLLFLHADTRLPANADRLVAAALASGRAWGRFDVRIVGRHRILPLVARAMNLRSRITGIATGDQAIFARRDALTAVGGYPDLPLMEDIALSQRLKRMFSRPACLRAIAETSGRRWEAYGPVRTILTMWRLRLAFFLGADPRRLAVRYGYSAVDA